MGGGKSSYQYSICSSPLPGLTNILPQYPFQRIGWVTTLQGTARNTEAISHFHLCPVPTLMCLCTPVFLQLLKLLQFHELHSAHMLTARTTTEIITIPPTTFLCSFLKFLLLSSVKTFKIVTYFNAKSSIVAYPC